MSVFLYILIVHSSRHYVIFHLPQLHRSTFPLLLIRIYVVHALPALFLFGVSHDMSRAIVALCADGELSVCIRTCSERSKIIMQRVSVKCGHILF